MDSVVTSVLNTILSEYVKTFNKKEVDLSVWSGEARLENVELKPSALDFLNLPISIRIGFISKIYLKVDWKKLKSKPAKIELDDVRIVCGPKSNFKITEQMKNISNKLKKLQKQNHYKVGKNLL